MANGLLIGFVIFLSLLVIACTITTFWMRSEAYACETTQSPYCYQYVCPSTSPAHPTCNNAAFRCESGTLNTDGTCTDNGKILCSS